MQIMKKVVIIDDEIDVKMVLELMISDVTEEFTSFTSPIDAEKYINEHKNEIAIIISDHRMPEMSGVDLFKSLENLKIPFALCTGMHPGEIADSIKSDLFYVMEKPFNEEELIDLVKSFVNK